MRQSNWTLALLGAMLTIGLTAYLSGLRRAPTTAQAAVTRRVAFQIILGVSGEANVDWSGSIEPTPLQNERLAILRYGYDRGRKLEMPHAQGKLLGYTLRAATASDLESRQNYHFERAWSSSLMRQEAAKFASIRRRGIFPSL